MSAAGRFAAGTSLALALAAPIAYGALAQRASVAAQQRLERQRPGGRVGLLVGAEGVADADPDRPDESRREPGCLECGTGEERRRGLAIRAGDADGEQLAARVAVPPRRSGGERRRSPVDHDLRHAGARDRRLDRDRRGPALDRLIDEFVTVDSEPANRSSGVFVTYRSMSE